MISCSHCGLSPYKTPVQGLSVLTASLCGWHFISSVLIMQMKERKAAGRVVTFEAGIVRIPLPSVTNDNNNKAILCNYDYFLLIQVY